MRIDLVHTQVLEKANSEEHSRQLVLMLQTELRELQEQTKIAVQDVRIRPCPCLCCKACLAACAKGHHLCGWMLFLALLRSEG